MPGNLLFRRWVDAYGRLLLVALALSAAVTVALLGASGRPSGSASALFATLCFIAGGRTLAGSARGLGLAPELRLGVTGVRTAAIQSGYFVGAAVGGIALAAGGYTRSRVSPSPRCSWARRFPHARPSTLRPR